MKFSSMELDRVLFERVALRESRSLEMHPVKLIEFQISRHLVHLRSILEIIL